MSISVWLGVMVAASVLGWAVSELGGTSTQFFGPHALIIVYGGAVSAMLLSSPLSQLWSAVGSTLSLFFPIGFPSLEASISEATKLARIAHKGGGLLAVQNESPRFARGFLHRAVATAISAAETNETRRIMEAEIRQTWTRLQEDANIVRTLSVLTPMFGLLGTLIGMVQVLRTMSDPTKVGPAMALALSSAFLGIATANFFCVPVAAHIRLKALRETLIFEVLLEGTLDIASGKSPYLVGMHLAAYSAKRQQELKKGATDEPPAAAIEEA